MTGYRGLAPDYQPWMDQAVCANTSPDLFFPEKNESAAPAKRVCGTCPVAGECLEFALTNREPFGVWGGLTTKERKKLLEPRHRYENATLKATVRELNRAGLMDSEIAARLGVSATHVSRVRRALGLPKNSSGGQRRAG